ncbi:MAG TPA: PqqD family protein [Thermoanaerobaculia bacterium]|nr:PqqD family protein [Thermoanaerobaculia bacterium]
MERAIRFNRRGEIVTRRIADESVLVPVANNVGNLEAVYTTSEVGDFIWSRIDGQTSVGEIVDALCDAYDVEPAQAEQDLEAFLASLQEAGLIEQATMEEG